MKQDVWWIVRAIALLPLCLVASSAQTFTTLVNFDAGNGGNVYAPLVQGIDGSFYGAGQAGAPHGAASIFRFSADGTLTTLGLSGRYPNGGLVQDTDGNLYGTTARGGRYGDGTIYEITPDGLLYDLFDFRVPRGAFPEAGLIQASDGNLYGTAGSGGANNGGVVFKYVPGGAEKPLYSFCTQPDCADGGGPTAKLVQATDGNLYGTTGSGCISPGPNCGTVFKITLKGALTTLHSFCSQLNCADGFNPNELIQATDGNLYGTTFFGGGTACLGGGGCGTIFKITSAGGLTTIYKFCSQPNCTDGSNPKAGLVLGTDGNFYGTTSYDGAHNAGTLFRLTPDGVFTTLYAFCSLGRCADGQAPYAALIQATDGNLYGTTYGNPARAEYGTIFKLSMGLAPFVKTLQASGKPGAPVTILGNNLAGATSVTFKGVPVDSFTVNATGSALFTTVPTGATTGVVRVKLADGTVLSSNVAFRVR